jgi:hypothetical protein
LITHLSARLFWPKAIYQALGRVDSARG